MIETPGKISALVLTLAVASVSGSSCAMPSTSAAGPCHVSGADKLPAEIGGASVICKAIERAMSAASPGTSYRVEVRILSPHALTATTRLRGRALPEQKMAVSDAALTMASIERFARAIGAQLANAGDR